MAHHFKIDDLLDDLQHPAFMRLVHDRRTTVNAAHAWLVKQGHRIGRTAVANFIKAQRGQAHVIAPAADLSDDQAARRFIDRWYGLLAGEELRTVAIFAAFMLNICAAREGFAIEAIDGFARLTAQSSRPKRRQKRRAQRSFKAALKR